MMPAPSKNLRIGLVCVALLALGSGCADDADTALICPSESGPFTLADGRVTGTIAFTPPVAPLKPGEALAIRGTANHEDGLAIREVVVAGVSATRTSFNFKQWNAEVTYSDLVTAASADTAGNIVATAFAIDACGNRYPFATLTVAVDQTPTLDVETLTLDIAYPTLGGATHDHLPANGSATAIVTITATGKADGATVKLNAASGVFQSLGAAGQVVLNTSFEDPDVATATVLYSASEPGFGVITAAVDGRLAALVVDAAGPPLLSPVGATVTPGGTLDVTVSSRGTLKSCQRTLTPFLNVFADGQVFGSSPIPVDPDDAGAVLLTLRASEDAAEGGTLTLTCTDVYGQSSAGSYTLVVTNPPAAFEVDMLTIEVLYYPVGDEVSYTALNGQFPAVLKITGTGRPNGAVVTLASTGGRFGLNDVGEVTLSGPPGGDTATDSVLFYPSEAGNVLVTASVGGAFTTATVRVAGPPVLAPGGAMILPGQSIDVVILLDGVLDSCQATPSQDLHVTTVDGTPVTAAGTDVAEEDNGTGLITVEADAFATAGSAVTVTCEDVFGQTGDAVFEVATP